MGLDPLLKGVIEDDPIERLGNLWWIDFIDLSHQIFADLVHLVF